jgi:Tfp pilus assembly protein PilF
MIKLIRLRYADLLILIVAGLSLVILRPSPMHQVIWREAQAGYEALQAGQDTHALAAFENALEAEPALGPLHLTAARLSLQNHDLGNAGYHLDQYQLQDPSHPDLICFRMILELLDSEKDEPQPIESTSGVNCALFIPLAIDHARGLLSAGQWDSAARLLSHSLDFQADNFSTLTEISHLLAIADPLEAIDSLQQVGALFGQNDSISLGLIRAIEDSRPSTDLAFTLAQVGQTFARSGMWLEASWAFRQAIDLDPEYVEALAYYGLALDQLGGDGFEFLSAAEAAYPNASLPHVFLGMHWATRGELSRAQLELEIAVGLDQSNPSSWAELGSVYAQQGMVAEAREAFIQATARAPGEWKFWYLLAQFSTNLEIELAEIGIPAARNLVTLDPADPRSYDLLGYAHFLNGNLPLAERNLLHAITLQPSLASAQYHLGQLRRWQGDNERSRAAFQLALQLDPNGPIGNLARRALGLPLAE